jgi:hypothetical protein
MTPKDKAQELVDKFIEHTMEFDELDGYVEDKDNAKQCALIAVDELIKNQEKITKNLNRYLSIANIEIQDTGDFWQEVKQEIEKL